MFLFDLSSYIPHMATGGTKLTYEDDDRVDEYLLNQISKWILYYRLPSLARDLGISQAEFSRVSVATSQPEEQIFKVSVKNANFIACHDNIS